LLQKRLSERKGHFFDPSLLQSQLDTLEPPGADEAIEADIAMTPDQIVEKVLKEVKER
jgi:gluconokinase